MIEESKVQTIRNWLKKNSIIDNKEFSDLLVEKFLHACDGCVEKTKKLIIHFLELRAEIPEFFRDRDPLSEEIQGTFKVGDYLPLKDLTPEGYQVFLYRIDDAEADNFSLLHYLKTFFLVADTRLHNITHISAGDIVIFDMDKFQLKHLSKISISLLRKYMRYTQEALPIKLKNIHVLNISPIIDKILVLVKPFMKTEVANMLHFHVRNSNTWQKYVPLEVMPSDYGGKGESCKIIKEYWKKRVEDDRKWLNESHWCDYNGKKNNDEVFIPEESFRKLEID